MNYTDLTDGMDRARIDKLNKLKDVDTFWKDVKKFTRQVKSERVKQRWQDLAERRYDELKKWAEVNKIYTFAEHEFSVTGNEHQLRELAEYLRDADGTLGDLRYKIEYEFDIDGVRTLNNEEEE